MVNDTGTVSEIAPVWLEFDRQIALTGVVRIKTRMRGMARVVDDGERKTGDGWGKWQAGVTKWKFRISNLEFGIMDYAAGLGD